MDYELPTEFDLIVIGTGVIESVISAAASRIGKRVLHIDSNNYYGGLWSSFNLDDIQKLDQLIEKKKTNPSDDVLKDGEKLLAIGNDLIQLKDFSCQWHIPEKIESSDLDKNEENTEGESAPKEKLKIYSQELLTKDSRKFIADLTPKLQFARGDFVELLISSNIARYSEYRSVSRVLTWLEGKLETVPCSRSDVFANNKVSVIEKRMLMKLLTSIDEEQKELILTDDKTYIDLLKEKKLSSNLIHYVLYALSMSTDETSCVDGIKNTKRFLSSLGRFGKTPFLFSMYGSGEITQAFCRLSAVFGGVFALNQPLQGFVTDSTDKFVSLLCGTQRINAENVVMDIAKAPEKFLNAYEGKFISRGVFITNKTILDGEKEHLTLLLYPPQNNKKLCVILELGTLTGTCPKGLYMVHITTEQVINPKEDLKSCIESLFKTESDVENVDNKPTLLWSCYFSIPDSNTADIKTNVPSNVRLCPGPDLDLDYDYSIGKAKEIFKDLYPEEEFLPRAPDADEIIVGEEAEPSEISKEDKEDMEKKTKVEVGSGEATS